MKPSVETKPSQGDRGNVPVYRNQPEKVLAQMDPIGERLDATPEDRRALSRSESREWSRIVGMMISAVVLFRWGIPLAGRVFPEDANMAAFVLGTCCVLLLVYAFWSWGNPRVKVPSIVRIDNQADEELSLTLERAFSLQIVLNPRNTLALDPLLVRFIARKAAKEDAAFCAEYVLDHGRSVGAGEAVRYTASIELPGEAPCTSPKNGIAWSIEVSAGGDVGILRALPLQVRPAVRSGRAGGKKARGTSAAQRKTP